MYTVTTFDFSITSCGVVESFSKFSGVNIKDKLGEEFQTSFETLIKAEINHQ